MKWITMECISTQPVAECVSSSNRRRVEEELVLGHELANQLRSIVSNGDCRSAEALVTKILCSFRNILHILNGSHRGSTEGPPEKLLISHIPANGIALPPLPPPPPPPILILESSSASDDAHKAVKRPAAFMDHRGSFKTRKKMTPQAWFRDSPDLNDDGHAWRKYGQKPIQNAIHPRSYFRCSHKHDQGCIATKQVQKLDDDPQRFRTTYIGSHTCSTNSFLKAPAFVLDTTSTTQPEVSDSKFKIIYGNSSLANINQEQPFFLSVEDELFIESSHTNGNLQQSSSLISSSGYPVSPEPISGMPPQIELDLEDMFLWAEMEQLPFDEEIFPFEFW